MKKSLIFILCVGLISCKKESSQLNPKNSPNKMSTSKTMPLEDDGDVVLGPQLQNPYTVANMQAAATAIQQQGFNYLTASQISATHYYVKFAPSDSDQYETLAADSTLKVYPYPLDQDLAQGGNRYHDPSLPSTSYTYQYASVKVGFVFPTGIPYTILAELYIPEEDPRIDDEISEQELFLDKLLDKAYTLTQNYGDTIKIIPTAKTTGSKYFPGGKIQIKDSRKNALFGMDGVEVRVRRWFTTYTARPNFYGDFRMSDDFKRDCNYSLWFSHNHFTVREHWYEQTAWIDGPKQAVDWNLNIESGYNRFIGSIFRGAFRYHYGPIGGLQRPYRPNGNRSIIVGKNHMGGSGINYGIVPILKVERYEGVGGSSTTEYETDEYFSTTIHELAHTSHIVKMSLGTIVYITVSKQIRESWATAVEWYLTQLEYKGTRSFANYGDPTWHDYAVSAPGYPNDYGYNNWDKVAHPDYTNIFINLVDDFNENGVAFVTGVGIATTNDQVKGYTLANIEANMLRNIQHLGSLKTQLKASKPSGVTDAQIDNLVAAYY